MNQPLFLLLLLTSTVLLLVVPDTAVLTLSAECKPTAEDQLGPFYKPNAPERESVGKGYELTGRALSSRDCTPIQGAKIELWMAGPDGQYTDEYRATLFSGEGGVYRFESHFPPSYSSRPPHIHIRVSASGYRTLVTQHYPVAGKAEASFDLVLVPAE
jgi:protocatechuate 3,4-dioxygenase beta subunit